MAASAVPSSKPDHQFGFDLALQIRAGSRPQQVQGHRAGTVGQRGERGPAQRRRTLHPHRPHQFASGAHRDHHAPGHSVIGVLGDEQRLVGGRQMRVHAPGIEECAQLLGCLSFDDGGHPRRVGVLLPPGIRQHPRKPVLDDDRAAGRFSQAVGQREQIRWATAGFGFAAFHNQSVDDGCQLTPRHRRVNHHHRDALVRAVECGVVVAAADQHDNRPRGGCPAHRFFD